MTTREVRLAQFTTDRDPPVLADCQVLCEDHVGTYVAPFLCRFADGEWHNAATGERVVANVVGWSLPRQRQWAERENRETEPPV